MESSNLLQRIITGYSKKKKDWEIGYDELLSFINNLVINDESGRYGIFSTNTSDILTAMLLDLEKTDSMELQYSGTAIVKIRNYRYLNQAVQAAFQDMESNSEYPFPTVGSLGISIPDDRIITLTLPENLSPALKSSGENDGKLYKLIISGELSPIIAEGGILRNRAIVLAVSKIRNHLAHKNNANYMYQKMLPMCKKNTRALVDTIKMVQSNPGRAASALKNPDEFIFSFWTQLSSFVRKDLAGKENKTAHDEGMLQSAYLINAYIIHYKNIIISNKRKAEALKFVGEKLKKEPFHFTISDIYSFSNKSGTMLGKVYKKEDLHDFINKKLQVRNNEVLPELIKVKTINNKLYYIHKSVFLNLVHKKINNAHDYYRKSYIDSWSEELKKYKAPRSMNNDEDFHADLEKRIKKEDPLLYAVLGYELLFLSINDTRNIKLKAVAQGWIDPKIQATRPLPIILGLNRRELASEVRSIVPFWLTIGFFRKLAAVFGGKKRKKKKKKKGMPQVSGQARNSNAPKSTASAGASFVSASGGADGRGRNKSIEYKKALDVLKKQFDYSSTSVYDRLDDLVHDWNPLLDQTARSNLVKDVNNMVRDYMRKILRETAFAVPDRERIDNITDLLAGNKAFSVIKKRESFRQYINLYIIKTLSETKP